MKYGIVYDIIQVLLQLYMTFGIYDRVPNTLKIFSKLPKRDIRLESQRGTLKAVENPVW